MVLQDLTLGNHNWALANNKTKGKSRRRGGIRRWTAPIERRGAMVQTWQQTCDKRRRLTTLLWKKLQQVAVDTNATVDNGEIDDVRAVMTNVHWHFLHYFSPWHSMPKKRMKRGSVHCSVGTLSGGGYGREDWGHSTNWHQQPASGLRHNNRLKCAFMTSRGGGMRVALALSGGLLEDLRKGLRLALVGNSDF
jgi:hypothetical protein